MVIQLYNAVDNGYNNSYGGNVPSEEGIQKIRDALTGIKRKKESIEKQLQTKQERYGNQKGNRYLSKAQARKVLCVETQDIFASIAEAERWCNSCKVGECCRGLRQHAGNHPITKQPLSWTYVSADSEVTIECNEAIQEKRKIKKVQCIETQEIYDNASAAEAQTGVACCNILRVCKGQRKSAGKLHWKFIEED